LLPENVLIIEPQKTVGTNPDAVSILLNDKLKKACLQSLLPKKTYAAPFISTKMRNEN
jgi:hypothetical protein